jgi:hypothetical protein
MLAVPSNDTPLIDLEFSNLRVDDANPIKFPVMLPSKLLATTLLN